MEVLIYSIHLDHERMFGWLVGGGGGSETTQEEEEAKAQLTLAGVSVSQRITG